MEAIEFIELIPNSIHYGSKLLFLKSDGIHYGYGSFWSESGDVSNCVIKFSTESQDTNLTQLYAFLVCMGLVNIECFDEFKSEVIKFLNWHPRAISYAKSPSRLGIKYSDSLLAELDSKLSKIKPIKCQL